MVSGSVMEVKLEHPRNVEPASEENVERSPMLVTLLGILMEVKLEQQLKA